MLDDQSARLVNSLTATASAPLDRRCRDEADAALRLDFESLFGIGAGGVVDGPAWVQLDRYKSSALGLPCAPANGPIVLALYSSAYSPLSTNIESRVALLGLASLTSCSARAMFCLEHTRLHSRGVNFD